MFSEQLSSSLLSICGSLKFAYETASELCNLSLGYFGSIARGKTSPTVNILEKLCIGLERTPHELLGFSAANEELSYCFPQQVTHCRQHFSLNHFYSTFLVCLAVIATWSANSGLSASAAVRSSAGIAFTMPR